jgi:MFS family permease
MRVHPPDTRTRRSAAAARRLRRTRGDRARLVLGIAVAVLLAAVLRVPNLDAQLPDLVHPDEPTVVERGLAALDGRLVPPQFDWPPASSYLYAAAVAGARLVDPDAATDQGGRYLLGRWLFLAVALLAVALTGALGARLADAPDRRLATAVAAAAALAVSYTSVRLSRVAHPEHLQIVLMLGAVLCALAFDRSRRLGLLAAAGALAGLAGATKYLGVSVGLVPLLAVLCWRPTPARLRLTQLATLAAAAVAGFLTGSLGTVLRGGEFLRGFWWQVGHQAGGHLGYEATGTGWVFHLTTSMPGNWGWPLTALAVGGTVAAAVRGSRDQRLVAAFVAVVFGLIGSSQIRFPHYVLILYPFLAALAAVALLRIRPRALAVAVTAAVVAGLAVTATDDVRLLRAAAAPDTRLLADRAAAGLEGPVWSEGHSLTVPRRAAGDEQRFAFGASPEVLDCRCFAVVSSYQEDRYRARPDLYAAEIGVYDALRSAGRTVSEIGPDPPLSYRWDLLPQWGLRAIPLVGPTGPVGPTITILDLTG